MASRDLTKLKELILYIAEKCQFRPNFGATMLNKILFFVDYLYYARYGESVTGAEYFKLYWGPAPKYLLKAREELVSEGLIIIQNRPTPLGPQERVVPTGKREANIGLFSAQMISFADSIIEEVKEESAESVSGMSHKFYGWQITPDKAIIPYETIFLKEPKPKTPSSYVLEKVAQLTAKNES